ncbi:MAG: YnbE family lipoprotein [Sphingopyxis terrae]|nr:YnbE family lipoprotein [Sphingopyxis terrae]
MRRAAIGGRCLLLTIGTMGLGGCVQVSAPDKPIEINLNIRIQQEVVYRIDGDAQKLIEQNGSIF